MYEGETCTRHKAQAILAVLHTVMSIGVAAETLTKNGFDLTDTLVSADEVLPGGPPRDGIPAIDHPIFVSATAADFLAGDDRVLGVRRNGMKKAYPIFRAVKNRKHITRSGCWKRYRSSFRFRTSDSEGD